MRIIITFLCFWVSLPAICQGPVAYWPFDNNASDLSGNHNDGVIHGNILSAMDRFGNPCGAYHFDGVSSYIEVPNSSSLQSPATAFTITVWYRFDNNKTNNWLTLLCKGRTTAELPGNPQYRLQVQQNTAPMINTCSPGGISGSGTISINTEFTECDQSFRNHLFEAGKWAFYALVYDGRSIRVYMNDAKVFEFAYSGILEKNQSPLFIGKDEPGNIEYFEGSLDDLNVFNRALSEQELHKLFSETRKANWIKEEFEMTAPGNQEVILPKNSCETIVNYTIPKITQPGCGTVSIKQVAGLPPGSGFTPGRHLVAFEAVSSTGYEQSCGFYIIVNDLIPPVIFMPPDTLIYIQHNEPGIVYAYRAPYAVDNCGVKSLTLVSGPATNDFLNPGKHVIRYKATDINGNSVEKAFTVEIKREPAKAPVVKAPPVDTPVYVPKAPKMDSVAVQKPDSSKVNTVPLITSQLTDSVKMHAPPDMLKRTNKEFRYLEVNAVKLIVKIYDRGVFDGDTVTIFLNKKVILYKQEVNTKGFSFEIAIDSAIDNELVFYAENLGSIPPNTASMVIEDGIDRYEANAISTKDENAVIRIRKKKK